MEACEDIWETSGRQLRCMWHTGSMKETTKSHPGDTQDAPRRHPPGIQEAPRRHPAGTQEAPRKQPGSTKEARDYLQQNVINPLSFATKGGQPSFPRRQELVTLTKSAACAQEFAGVDDAQTLQ